MFAKLAGFVDECVLDCNSITVVTDAGEPTFTANQGWTNNNSIGAYFQIPINPYTVFTTKWYYNNGGNQPCGHMACWLNTNSSGGSGGLEMGLLNIAGSHYSGISTRSSLNTYFMPQLEQTDGGGTNQGSTPGNDGRGFWVVSRSSTTTSQGYVGRADLAGGSSAVVNLFTSTSASVPGGVENSHMGLLGGWVTSGFVSGAVNQKSAFTIGAGITSSAMDAVYSRINTFRLAVGLTNP